MSGHTRWYDVHEARLRRMTAAQLHSYESGRKVMREHVEREVWLSGVEGWLCRALNDVRLNKTPEPLAWPVRTLADLAIVAAREYPACAAPDDEGLGEFAHLTYDEIKREANVLLLDEFWRITDESDVDTPPEWKKSAEQRRSWAEDLYDRVISQRDEHGRFPDNEHYGHEHG